jgi:hypothetical protein
MQPSAESNPKKRKRNEVSELEIPDDLMQQEQRLTRNQQRRVGMIADQLAFLESHEEIVLNKVRKNARKLPKGPLVKRYRTLTLDEQKRVLWLRFGSLDSMDKPWHTSKEVFHMTGVRPGAQYNVIKRWLQRGKRVVSLKYMRGPNKMLSYDDRVYIANPRTLMDMRHLNLIERAQALKE